MTFADAVPGPDGQPLDQIRLSGVTATGHHGVLPEERAEGQTFRADVVLHLDTRAAASSDDLAATVSYAEVAEDVHDVLAGSPADLVETVAERIAAVVLERGPVQAVDVRVHKPQAPISVPFDDVEIVVRRDRERMPAVSVPAAQEPATAPEPPPVPPAPVPAPSGPVPVAVAEQSAHVPDTGETMISAIPVELAPVPAPEPTPAAASASEPEPTPGPESAPEPEPAAAAPADPLDAAPSGPVEAVLALGSNLGDPQGTLRAAVTDIDRIPGLQVMEVSPLARTAAVGPEQPDFLNAVLIVRTTLPPRDLLGACQEVELMHGRVREERWGPRTLDVDLVQYDGLVASAEDLELPHPRARERAFVLVPWAEVDPDAVLGGLGGGPVAQLAATAPDRPGIRWLALDWLTEPATTGAVAAQPQAAAEPEPAEYAEQPEQQQPEQEQHAALPVRDAQPPAGPYTPAQGDPAVPQPLPPAPGPMPPSVPVPRQDGPPSTGPTAQAAWVYEPEQVPERQEPPAFVPAAQEPTSYAAPEPTPAAEQRPEHAPERPSEQYPHYAPQADYAPQLGYAPQAEYAPQPDYAPEPPVQSTRPQPVYAEPHRTVAPPSVSPAPASPPAPYSGHVEQATVPAPHQHAPIPPAPDADPGRP
ncbi:2-amino-4-hydroxy-6-hydroxymethyldihydropteridine diphosphokinase [Isoptericola sp. S6320L]|uniref:2-amino-4-hydroxy-6- hydroxymethyldihydropteridine diphosphokinase n=1 Tax=Isoptericola sp. S6320L TaxID=2926411 RepID=UPI001FF64028|nr:2-amino-4-hydroxy-6-hydroxymethyldihydropteridine diphosphokinase [Isoptericola sp. S6320L]MCK0116370.1 2-amino-4-hydroxy-6-hydroxymethyldihydropteridine diphosphokinase [Isoptericola sp. S6320L]